MRFCAIIAGLVHLLIASQSVSAQGVETVLRAGEHAEFTRLVMSLPESTDWRLAEGDRQIDILFSNPAPRVDLSETFERIPRTRLSRVEPIIGGLRLHLACQCSARRVDGVPGQLVLDLWSPEPAKARDPAASRPRPRPEPAPELMLAQNAGVALARQMRTWSTPAGSSASELSTRGSPGSDSPPPPDATRAALDVVDDDLTEKLGAAISGAVANKLLQPDPDFERPLTTALPPIPARSLRHLQSLEDRRDAPKPLPGQLCKAAVSAAIAEWSLSPPPGAAFQNWQSLYDPLDRLNTKAAFLLTTELLRSGFGAEARGILALVPETDRIAALSELSYIIDLEPPLNPQVLTEFAECSDMDMLWAFLSDPAATLTLPNAPNRIIRATQGLSDQLQRHLGRPIIHQLLRHEATEAAALVQKAIDRSISASGTNAIPDLLTAEPENLQGLQVVDLLDMPDPELLLLMENIERSDAAIPPDLLSLAIDRQFALRRTPLGRDFALVAARLLARAQDYDVAFRIARSSETNMTPAMRTALLSDLFYSLAQTAPDTVFVTTTFAQTPWNDPTLSVETVSALRARLTALGFAEAAKQLGPAPEQGGAPPPSAGANIATVQDMAQMDPPARGVERATASPSEQANGIDDAGSDLASLPSGGPPVSIAAPIEPPAPPPDRNTLANAPRGDIARPEGLLANGRNALERAADLRARLQALIVDPPTELTQ